MNSDLQDSDQVTDKQGYGCGGGAGFSVLGLSKQHSSFPIKSEWRVRSRVRERVIEGKRGEKSDGQGGRDVGSGQWKGEWERDRLTEIKKWERERKRAGVSEEKGNDMEIEIRKPEINKIQWKKNTDGGAAGTGTFFKYFLKVPPSGFGGSSTVTQFPRERQSEESTVET